MLLKNGSHLVSPFWIFYELEFAGFFKRLTFTQTALRQFVVVYKQLYCSSHDLIGCQNISASEKIVAYIQNKSEQPTRSDLFCEVAPIYDLNLQVFWLP